MASGSVDRAVLAARIQGFGNVNPPPLEDDTGSTIAKRAVSRLGDMVGEEVMLTVEDFREKGAVGVVKDAVADAGDILIDGVSGLIVWIRGDPAPEDDGEKAEEASKALANGPGGAAYGISQASPTGGINAVWVMPEDADPACLAQLAAQQGPAFAQQHNDPRVPSNILPYQAAPSSSSRSAPQPYAQTPYSIPGGPTIAPYEPAPSGSSPRPPPFVPAGSASSSAGRWGPGGYTTPSAPAGYASAPAPTPPPAGPKAFLDRIARGEVLVGADVAKRLASQCQATGTSGKKLGEAIVERAHRLYLGLDGGDPAEADATLLRLLGLVDALALLPSSELAHAAAKEAKAAAQEEFSSLRSCAAQRAAAEPLLRRLQIGEAADVDLLGDAARADLGSGPTAPAAATGEAHDDLLGGGDFGAGVSSALLGGAEGGANTAVSGGATDGLLDAWLPEPPSASAETSAIVPVVAQVCGDAAHAAGTLGSGARLEEKRDEDVFGFVGAELSKVGVQK